MAPSRKIPIVKSGSEGPGTSPNSRYQLSSTPTGRLRLSGVSPGDEDDSGEGSGSEGSTDYLTPSVPFAGSSTLTPGNGSGDGSGDGGRSPTSISFASSSTLTLPGNGSGNGSLTSSIPFTSSSTLTSENSSRNGSRNGSPTSSIPFAGPSTLTPTPSNSTLTNYSPTIAPSQIHDHKIPIIVGMCISTAFILATAIIFIVWYLRKIQHIQTGEAQSAILSIDTPQPTPTTGQVPHEQQLSSSNNVARFLLKSITKKQRTQRDQQSSFDSHTREINSPVGLLQRTIERRLRIFLAERSAEIEQQMAILHTHVQQLSGQVEHLKRQLVHANRDQSLSDEEPPAYV